MHLSLLLIMKCTELEVYSRHICPVHTTLSHSWPNICSIYLHLHFMWKPFQSTFALFIFNCSHCLSGAVVVSSVWVVIIALWLFNPHHAPHLTVKGKKWVWIKNREMQQWGEMVMWLQSDCLDFFLGESPSPLSVSVSERLSLDLICSLCLLS